MRQDLKILLLLVRRSKNRIDVTDRMNDWAGMGGVDSGGGLWDPRVGRGRLALVVFIFLASTGSFAGDEPLREGALSRSYQAFWELFRGKSALQKPLRCHFLQMSDGAAVEAPELDI
jgi:hypothetical protein